MTFDASAWYAGSGFTIMAIVVAIALYGFRAALAGRPMVSAPGLED